MQVTFYSNFKKRINSTKRPSGGTVIDVNIKDKCDLHKPVLKIQGTAGQYNYFKIDDTFYFVDGEAVMPAGWVEISGEPDAMATCADDVKATRAFIERSASGSTNLLDGYSPAMSSGIIGNESEQLLFPLSKTGSFLVSLSNFVQPLKMDLGQFTNLYNKLNSKDAIQQVENSFADLSGIVKGAVWVPYDIKTLGSVAIKAGDFDTGVTGDIVAQEITTAQATFDLGIDGTVLSSSAYSEVKLYLPFAGATTLSIDDFRTGGQLSVLADLDNLSGNISYYISDSAFLSPVASFSGSAAVPIAIGSTSYGISGGISGLVRGLSYFLSTGSGAGFFQASHSGSQMGSGFRSSLASVVCATVKRDAPEALSAKSGVVGLPTYRTASIGSMSGFIKCINASIESHHDYSLVESCNNFLNSGAYIE